MDEALQVLRHRSITQAEHGPSWRLAASVKALRNDGWAIRVRMVTRHGCRARIAEYALDRSDPATAAALAARGE